MSKEDSDDTSLLHTDSELANEYPDDGWLILGMRKGYIIFFNIMNFSRLHARYEVSKGDVTMVREVVRRN